MLFHTPQTFDVSMHAFCQPPQQNPKLPLTARKMRVFVVCLLLLAIATGAWAGPKVEVADYW